MNLLIADDEAVIRRGLMSLDWSAIGIGEVFEARDGLQAKKLLDEKNVDIILSDIRMPGFTGLDLAEYIKEYSLDVGIILLSGYSEFDYVLEALRNQVYDYLLKPLHPEQILKSVFTVEKRLMRKREEARIVEKYDQAADFSDISKQVLDAFPKSRRDVLEILVYIAKNCSGNISLNSLAGHFHFSPAYISKIIKRETGFSFVDILTAVRLCVCLSLIDQPGKKISAICDGAGFSNQNYFSQLFKKVFGVSPMDYKKLPNREKSLRQVLEMMNGDR